MPAERAYTTENVQPSKWRERDQGRWVAEDEWPSKAIEPVAFFPAADGRLTLLPPSSATLSVKSPQDTGIMSGEFFVLRPDGEMPADQRLDDANSLCFETHDLKQPLEILGRPRLKLRVAIDQPLGNLIVRLNDVHPDGVSQRVSFGVLNLAHRDGNASPVPMVPGELVEVEILLDECGHRFLSGHRARIAISTAYWPLLQPPPKAITATIELGPKTSIKLPVRKGGDQIDMPEPADKTPLPDYPQISTGENRRSFGRELNDGLSHYHLVDDSGFFEVPTAEGMVVRERREEHFSIDPNDPIGSNASVFWTVTRKRGDWRVRIESSTLLALGRTDFRIEATVAAFEGPQDNEILVYERKWAERIDRNHM